MTAATAWRVAGAGWRPRRTWLWAITLLGALPGHGIAADAACDCLNWKEVYDAGRALCGEGLELYELVKPRANLSLLETGLIWLDIGEFSYDEFCTSFFRRMDGNHCVNVGLSPYGTKGWQGEQWCYVSSRCRELNGGQRVSDKESYPWLLHWLSRLPSSVYGPLSRSLLAWSAAAAVPRDVSWKLCTRGRDARLRDLAPEAAVALAERLGAAPGFVTKLAYQSLPSPEWTWGAVREAVTAGDIGSMPPLLVQAIAAKAPVVIDLEAGGRAGQRIVRGTEIYELEPPTAGGRWAFRRGRDVGEL